MLSVVCFISDFVVSTKSFEYAIKSSGAGDQVVALLPISTFTFLIEYVASALPPAADVVLNAIHFNCLPSSNDFTFAFAVHL